MIVVRYNFDSLSGKCHFNLLEISRDSAEISHFSPIILVDTTPLDGSAFLHVYGPRELL